MEKGVRKKILRDYRKANDNIRRILSERANFFVKGEYYLAPTISCKSLSMDDPRGEFRYFKKICDCLENILIHEKTQFKLSNVPNYIEEFFE